MISNPRLFVRVFHILFVGGLFLYIGISQKNIPSVMYPFMVGLGLIIILYHCYKTYIKLIANQNPWVNYIHIILIGPLLMYIGFTTPNTGAKYFDYLAIIAYSALIYHGYYLSKAYL